MYKKLECSLYSILILGWFIGCQQLIVYLMKLFFQRNGLLFSRIYNSHMYKINLLMQIVCFIGVFAIDFTKNRNSIRAHNTFRKRKILVYILYGIGFWFLSGLVNMLLLGMFPEYPMQIQLLFSNTESISRFLVLVLAAPLLEEYVFRGKIQNQLQKGFGDKRAIVLQGIVFGIIHPFPLQKIYASLLGVGLGIIKEKEQNLQSVIIIHMTINLIGFIIGTLAIR